MSQLINLSAIAFCGLSAAMIASMMLIAGIGSLRSRKLYVQNQEDIYRDRNPVMFWFGTVLWILSGSCGLLAILIVVYIVIFA